MCTLAVIEEKAPGRTGYFVDEQLVKSVVCVEGHTLDWLLEDQGWYEKSTVKFDGFYLG